MPGKIGTRWRSFATRLSRISSFTRRARSLASENGLWRNSPSVRGKLIYYPRRNLWCRLYSLASVTVAPGFVADAQRATHRRQDVSQESNDGPQTLRFGIHSQQSL